MPQGVLLALRFEGRWRVENSPARRIPGHGTDVMGGRYAIDFVGVDDRHRSAAHNDWRTVLATEPVERFFAFGRPILAPTGGVVVRRHDGESDHVARRSQPSRVSYALGQASRVRHGVSAVAGNHVVIALPGNDVFVALVHLRAGSVAVAVGDEVTTGQRLAECGNSGNSTQPHLHVQVMDCPDPARASGVPMTFRRFREWPRRGSAARVRDSGLPDDGAIVEPLPHSPSRDEPRRTPPTPVE